MIFLEVLEVSAVVIWVLLMCTQVLAPTVRGEPWFPMFRRKLGHRDLQRRLKEAREKCEQAQLEQQVLEAEFEAMQKERDARARSMEILARDLDTLDKTKSDIRFDSSDSMDH